MNPGAFGPDAPKALWREQLRDMILALVQSVSP